MTEEPQKSLTSKDAVFIGETLLACQNGDKELLTPEKIPKIDVNLDESMNEVVEFLKNKEFKYLSKFFLK